MGLLPLRELALLKGVHQGGDLFAPVSCWLLSSAVGSVHRSLCFGDVVRRVQSAIA